MSDNDRPGVWFCYSFDWNAVPKAVFSDELDARRWAMDNYAEVVFWPYGIEWDEVGR